MGIVVDASVVIAALLPEQQSADARAVLAEADVVYAPDLLLYEIVSTLRARLARGDLTFEEADSKRLEARAFPAHYQAAFELDAQSLALAVLLEHSAYDCFYLALAIDQECELVTADRRFVAVVRTAGLGAHVRLLGEESGQ